MLELATKQFRGLTCQEARRQKDRDHRCSQIHGDLMLYSEIEARKMPSQLNISTAIHFINFVK